MRDKTVVLSIYVKGEYLCTTRKPVSELPQWREAFRGVAGFTLVEEGGIADYYKVDINKKPELVKIGEEQ
jgi:hypothetical protein